MTPAARRRNRDRTMHTNRLEMTRVFRDVRLLIPLLALGVTACDPCTGIGTCVAPQVRYEGEVTRGVAPGVDPIPAPDVAVEFIRTGGVRLARDTVSGRSDEQGRFRLEMDAEAEGEVVGDLWMYPPEPAPSHRVRGVRMTTTRGPGDVRALGSWKVSYPRMGYQFYLYYRATRQPARGIEVEFRRTSGVAVEPSRFRAATDPRGYVVYRPQTPESGTITGDLTVYPLPPAQPFTVPGLRMRTVVTERFDSIFTIGIGYGLPYSLILVWESSGKGVPGAEVEFVRRGGVPIAPARYVVRSDAFGTVLINPTPLAEGEVWGDVVVRPPPPGERVVFPNVRLATVADDRATELLGYWAVPDR